MNSNATKPTRREHGERIAALIDALGRNPRLVGTDWARAIPRELAKRPASERPVLLACWERWSRRQAAILLEESSPLTGRIQ